MDGSCEGSYSLQEGGKGTWQIVCTNNMGAAGTLKWGDSGTTGIGRDYKDKKVKFTVAKKSQMKKILTFTFILLISFSTQIFADETEFQIEGMSLGDSLLDY